MSEFVAEVGQNGRVVIPNGVRKAYGINEGDFVRLSYIAKVGESTKKEQAKFAGKLRA